MIAVLYGILFLSVVGFLGYWLSYHSERVDKEIKKYYEHHR